LRKELGDILKRHHTTFECLSRALDLNPPHFSMMVNGYYHLAPGANLLERIVTHLSLSESESASLNKAARLTDRILFIPRKAGFEHYVLAHCVMDLITENDERLKAIEELINQLTSGGETTR